MQFKHGASIPMTFHYPSRIIAHRGAGTLAPENTLEAMQLARAKGVAAVEFDVMLSRDQQPVLMHDPQFGRTVPGTGAVDQTDAAQLLQMNAGAWLGDARFSEVRVPHFAAVLDFCRDHALFMNVEIKPAPGHDVVTGRVVADVTAQHFAALPSTAWPVLSSFSPAALDAARTAQPALPRALLFENVPGDWQAQIDSLACVALHCHHAALTPAVASAVKAAGLALMVYTVNDPDRARTLFGWGVDAVCTDRPDLLRQL
jgi:glycerophosphoryl diester phosphodiesterase